MIQLLYNKKNQKTTVEILNNKTFVFHYSKFFIRNNFNNKEIILDNYFEIASGLNKIDYNNSGYSIVLNRFLYKHKLDKNLKFYWFNPKINLQQNLNTYFNSISKKNNVFFTNIIKGGIECYSCGFRGFLPKEHFLLVAKHLRSCILNFKLKIFFLSKNKSKYFYLKAPTRLTKLTVYTSSLKNTTIKKNKNLLNINNKINIVFNYPKHILNYENKKKFKKNRKLHFKKKNRKF